MPYGKGTYGSQVGRPKKKNNKNKKNNNYGLWIYKTLKKHNILLKMIKFVFVKLKK